MNMYHQLSQKINHIDTDQKTKKNNNTPRLSIVPKQVYMVIWPACIATYIYFKFMSRPIYQKHNLQNLRVFWLEHKKKLNVRRT